MGKKRKPPARIFAGYWAKEVKAKRRTTQELADDTPFSVRTIQRYVYQLEGVPSPRETDGNWWLQGSRSPNAKLVEEDIREIRERYALGETTTGLAKEYGVSSSMISRIGRRLAWKHVK